MCAHIVVSFGFLSGFQAQLESKVSRLEAQLEATVKQSDRAVAKERARSQMLSLDRGSDAKAQAALQRENAELKNQVEFHQRRAAELQAGLRLGAALAAKSRSGSPLISPVGEHPLSPSAVGLEDLERLQESLAVAAQDFAAIEASRTSPAQPQDPTLQS